VDGETTPSIEFIPSRACGVGFDNQAAPWGTKWFGKAAKATGWFHNFRIPFKSIRITYQLETNETDQHIFLIVRGLENYKFTIGDIPVPTTARLKLIKTNVTLQPLEFVDLVNIQHGSGMLFLTMMQVSSQSINFLEGCFHFYNQKYVDWPGMLMSVRVPKIITTVLIILTVVNIICLFQDSPITYQQLQIQLPNGVHTVSMKWILLSSRKVCDFNWEKMYN